MADSTLPSPDLDRLKIRRGAAKPASGGGGFGKFIVLLFVLAAAAGAYWQRDRFLPKEKSSAPLRRSTVVREFVDMDLGASAASANGYVVARRKAALSTIIPGRLVDLKVEEGSKVAANEIIAQIQNDDYQNDVLQAETAVSIVEAEINSAKKQLDLEKKRVDEAEAAVEVARRTSDELKLDAANMQREMERQRASRDAAKDLSLSEWDRMESTAKIAATRAATSDARVNALVLAVKTAETNRERQEKEIARLETTKKRAEAALESARIVLEKTRIRAPFAGTITRKEAEEGEVVAATGFSNSRGSVATLVDMATLEVQVELTEKNLGDIKGDSEAYIILDAQPQKRWRGHVRQIWPTADRQKGTIELRIVFDERPEVLRPEMGARVDFRTSAASRPATSDQPKLVVAAAAVMSPAKDPYVFLIAGEQVKRKSVRLGQKRGSDYAIESGLERGDKVVLEPGEALRDGDRWVESEDVK